MSYCCHLSRLTFDYYKTVILSNIVYDFLCRKNLMEECIFKKKVYCAIFQNIFIDMNSVNML